MKLKETTQAGRIAVVLLVLGAVASLWEPSVGAVAAAVAVPFGLLWMYGRYLEARHGQGPTS